MIPAGIPSFCPGNWPGSSLQQRQWYLSEISISSAPLLPQGHTITTEEKRDKPGSCPLQTQPAGTPCWIPMPGTGPATKATAPCPFPIPCPFPEPEFPCAAHPAPGTWSKGRVTDSAFGHGQEWREGSTKSSTLGRRWRKGHYCLRAWSNPQPWELPKSVSTAGLSTNCLPFSSTGKSFPVRTV